MKPLGVLEQSEVRAAAREVLSSPVTRVTALPVDPSEIATCKGITVQSAPLQDCAGSLFKVGDTFGILYSDKLGNEGFERFSVAHELGHYFLPRHPEHIFANGRTQHLSHSGFVSDDRHEMEADLFAVELLMPEQLFLPALRAQRVVGMDAIEGLASLCRTSLTAMALRFAEYADDPVVVVMTQGDTVLWCSMSQAIRDLRGLTWPKKGSPVPKDSVTYQFNRDKSKIAGAARADGASYLDSWIDGAPSVELAEDVIGLGSYGRTLSILFTQDALRGEDDEDEDREFDD